MTTALNPAAATAGPMVTPWIHQKELYIHSLVNPQYNNYLVKFRRMSKFLSILEKDLSSITNKHHKAQAVHQQQLSWFDELEAQQQDIVLLDVGGTLFKTCKSTLLTAADSYFSTLFNGNWSLGYHEDEDNVVTEQFVDRDPKYFDVLLQYLRDDCPKGVVESLYKHGSGMNAEARYFGIDRVVQYTQKCYVTTFDAHTKDVLLSRNGTAAEGIGESEGIRCIVNSSGYLQQTTFAVKLLNHPTNGISIGFKTQQINPLRGSKSTRTTTKGAPYFSYHNQYYIGFSPVSCWVSYKSVSGASAHKFADKIQQISDISGYTVQTCFERGGKEKSSVVWFKLISPGGICTEDFEIDHVSYWNIPANMLVFPCVYAFGVGDKFELAAHV